ncbi:iron ABC transporter permease [Uliginosibacterium sp. H3]|uniref:Iron ABC transporter permease n=1 Tax=Uliginosibacterium silvisoli TaxID=3114758 RepID=A0ABU6K4G0_9RHOO|nr:iron ABC transporter permease [Uliginosibacterium sp. H3]
MQHGPALPAHGVAFNWRYAVSVRLSGGLGAGWLLIAAIVALLVLLPVFSLGHHALQGSGELWSHLAAYVLPQALRDSLLLLSGVGIMVVTLGSSLAWLVTAYSFPGRRLLSWALLLPLAVPTYIVAFAYLDLWHPVGALQTGLRGLLGYESPRDLRLPDIRSMWGCILLLGLVLYPYVYLPARALFQMQAGGLIDASRTLGAGPWRSFFRVALPLARPAIAVGASLALMEALNDIGAAEFLGVRTLTVSIYATWVNRSSLPGAAQIALFMLAIVLSLIALERWARRHQRYATSGRQARPLAAQPLKGWRGLLACALASVPLLLGFALPVGYLVVEATKRFNFAGLEASILRETLNTVGMSALATLVATALAFLMAFILRVTRGQAPLVSMLVRCASLGYAIPGTLLAIGLLGPLAGFDNAFSSFLEQSFGISTGLLLSGSGAALVYAYVARFLAVGSGSIEAGFSKIPHSLDDAARALGEHAGGVARRIHLPLGMPAIAAAMLLVFVDCMKELPATLLLRPLNFETLATHLYGEAARGTYESGAIAALLIVLAGLLPIILLSRIGQAPASRKTAQAADAAAALPDLHAYRT